MTDLADIPPYTGPALRDYDIEQNEDGLFEVWFAECEFGGEFLTRQQAERFAGSEPRPAETPEESLGSKILAGTAFVLFMLGLLAVLGLQ